MTAQLMVTDANWFKGITYRLFLLAASFKASFSESVSTEARLSSNEMTVNSDFRKKFAWKYSAGRNFRMGYFCQCDTQLSRE
ncbi:hypothetical protein [Caballeronia sp. AZ10_KS36]|uniref:hypothetical protein n=1 Tax=Caballeronia sp. AZ10_KS36 TaxID=2921757 RepID=UPI002028074D|nr:hypothetical protein [Caballeronia sp. AZ10_KS36]